MANSIIPSPQIDKAQVLVWKYRDLLGTREWHYFNKSLTVEKEAGIDRLLAKYRDGACVIMGESWVDSALGDQV